MDQKDQYSCPAGFGDLCYPINFILVNLKRYFMLDIKIPIGLMFSVFGVILLVYGFFTRNDTELYQRSLSYNMNLWMGGLMLVFGVVMLLLVKRKKD